MSDNSKVREKTNFGSSFYILALTDNPSIQLSQQTKHYFCLSIHCSPSFFEVVFMETDDSSELTIMFSTGAGTRSRIKSLNKVVIG